MIVSLAGKVPSRGAVSIGTGMELETGSFYGPALAEAHRLESKVADYPRIVVSAETAEFAKGGGGFSSHGAIETIMNSLAATCRSLLCVDTDGQVIVDYLGEGMHSVLDGATPDMIQAIEAAYPFVCAEAVRFAEAKDAKHAERYAALRGYVESRLPIWGLEHLVGEAG